MKITIFAATGGIGRHALEHAVDAGHEVTAVVRNPAKLSRQVHTIRADLSDPDPAALATAVEGADAVLSGLGPKGKSEFGVAEHGTKAIVAAMLATGVKRIVAISAAPIGTVATPRRPNPPKHDPGEGFFMRHALTPMIKLVLRRHYADVAAMEDVLRDSGLDWTALRPPQLTDKPATGKYRVAIGHNLKGGSSISRADTAAHMLRVLEQPETIGHTVGLAY